MKVITPILSKLEIILKKSNTAVRLKKLSLSMIPRYDFHYLIQP